MLPVDTAVNSTEALLPKTPLEVLRERTRELHVQLEEAINVSASLTSVARYIHLLCRYRNIYNSFEVALQRQAAHIHNTASQAYQSRVLLLERDLRALGVNPQNCSGQTTRISLPDLGESDFVLGALYVVEGSNLGGQIIYREIQKKLGLDVNTGAAFFFGNGEQTGAAWKRFTSLLNERVAEPGRAADAAAAMFRTFELGLQMTPEDEQTV